MKKFIIKTLAALFLTASFTCAYSLEAKVLAASGKTQVKSGNSWADLKVGSTIAKGDVIQTGYKSKLTLKIGESTVEVAPLSRITVEQLVSKDTKDVTSLYLDTGSVKSDVKKTDKRRVGFTVRSPAATASVRGTILGVETRYRGTDIKTYSGSVATWKTTNKKATVTTEEQDNEPAAPATTGSAPSDIAEAAPRGAQLVNAGQSSSYTSTGTSTSTQDNAKKASYGMNSVPSAAGTAPVTTSHAEQPAEPVNPPAENVPTTGTLVITPIWAN